MKGKTKKINNLTKGLLLAVSFVLTIVLTATLTLAWFYDTDWASSTTQMAGAVGIEMRDNQKKATSGTGNLHFMLYDSSSSQLAYPGQAIDVSASVFNNGGSSIINYFEEKNQDNYTDDDIKDAGDQLVGSACYVRAHFAVYTNIGTDADPDTDKLLNSQGLYEFLIGLIEAQNKAQSNYRWVYYNNPNPKKTLQGSTYFNGTKLDADNTAGIDAEIAKYSGDGGYFYLCQTDNKTLLPLSVGSEAVFLWNDQFIIPWQLTNDSADKLIFVGLSFQAIQTFIPEIDADGEIRKTAIERVTGEEAKTGDNQLLAKYCTYNHTSIQTLFNTSNFDEIITEVDGINFGAAPYVKASMPTNIADDPTLKPAA